MSTKNVDGLTPGQCRGARGMLGISQAELAKAAGLGLSTIVDFEKSRRPVSADSIYKIREALFRAGIEFLASNGGGVGVRLKKSRKT
jgi:transcriptional regulator with XRE-family HTH domain